MNIVFRHLPGLVLLACLASAAAQAPAPVACPTAGSCLPPEEDELQRQGFAVRLSDLNWSQVTPIAAGGPKPAGKGKHTGAGKGKDDEEDDDQDDDDDEDAPPVALAWQASLLGPMSDAAPATEAVTAVYRGNAAAIQGRFQAARDFYQQALRLGGPQKERAQAAARANLGAVLAVMGQYAQARAMLQQAQADLHALPPPAGNGQPQGATSAPLNPELARQIAAWSQVLRRTPGDPVQQAWAPLCELRNLLNLANLEGQLSQYAQADQWLQQAQRLARELAQRHGLPALERWVAMEQAVLLQQSGRSQAAQASLQLARQGPAFTRTDLSWLGTRVLALGNQGASTATEKRLSFAQQAASSPSDPDPTPPVRDMPSHSAVAAMAHLQQVAEAAEARGDTPQALAATLRLAMLAAIVGNPERERLALAQAAGLQARQGGMGAAIYLGKRSVNTAQRLRSEVGDMPAQARQRYMAARKQSYVQLVSWLMQAQRLPEAELVLRLMKEDEGQQFMPTADALRKPRGQVPYSLAEQAVLSRHDAWRDSMRQLCLDRGCGVLGVAQPELEELAASLSRQLDGAEAAAQQLKPPADVLPADDLRRARSIAARPPASRSAADQALLDKLATVRQVYTGTLDNISLALRALKQEAELTGRQLKPQDLRRVDTLLQRTEPVLAQWRTQLGFIDGRPDPHAGGAANMLAMLMSGGATQTVGDWSATRQLEELEAQRVQFDQQLPAQLDARAHGDAKAKEGSATAFLPADQATLQAGQSLLQRLPTGTVALYYLVEDQHLNMLLVSAAERAVFRQALPRATLASGIDSMRSALLSPRSNPLPPAQAMHGLVMAPMEATLKRMGARTLMVSLDGPLRSLPFAALHDGQQWLMARYAVNVYTTASPAALSQVPAKPWRAAAFGSSEGGAGLQALPGVRQELEAIVSDPTRATGGAMPGTIALNQAFTARALQALASTTASGQTRASGAPNLLHIASHFVFKPGDPGASFLLLGDGQQLTLSELAQPGWRFDHLNLLTLSACQTARSGDDQFGQEIEGLGTLLQAQGAAAVLASLWQVNDAATARLMQQLYLQLQSQAGTSKAEALRRAQQAMVDPSLQIGPSPAPAQADKASARPQPARGVDLDGADPAPAPAQATFAHPYFWAPFVLMGNWL